MGPLEGRYERQCYLDAEKAARERLTLLQASSTAKSSRFGNEDRFDNNPRIRATDRASSHRLPRQRRSRPTPSISTIYA